MTDYIKELLQIAGCSALFVARRILSGIEQVPDCVNDLELRRNLNLEIETDSESVDCEALAFLFLVACGAIAGSEIGKVIKENVVANSIPAGATL